MLQKNDRIALVSANGIGDGLLTMVIANNLQKNGYSVVTFSSPMVQLQSWFPGQVIAPFPALEQAESTFKEFDKVFSTDGAFLYRNKIDLGKKYHVFFEHSFDRKQTVLQNFINICKDFFALPSITASNNLTVIQAKLQHRLYRSRVLIHPMSTCDKKNWSAEKFLKLAQKLHRRGFTPVFIVSPAEYSMWENVVQGEFTLPVFNTLSDLAQFVYESGYMIGNDSGIGHLACNLSIPTLSLFARKSVANLWRPGWGDNARVVTPCQLPGARLQTKHWKKLLTVSRVIRHFNQLIAL